jgi:sugar lactone lactonase YvrE
MKLSNFGRYFVGIGAAGALAGCSGSQPPIGGAGAVPQSLPIVTHAATRHEPQYLYVADQSPYRIDIFLRDDPSKGVVDSISKGVSSPDGIWVDSSGNLYVANEDQSTNDRVTVYAKGGHRPIRVYKAHILCASDVAVASDGTVYVADPCGRGYNGRVHVFGPGGTKQTRILYPDGAPGSVTVDAQNNLYVGMTSNKTGWAQVKRYRPGATKGVDMLRPLSIVSIAGVAVDDHGALLVADQDHGTIDVFTGAHSKHPSRVINTGQSYPCCFAFDRRGNTIYVSYPYQFTSGMRALGSGPQLPNTVVALDYASGRRLWTLQVPNWLPVGVAVSPTAPF